MQNIKQSRNITRFPQPNKNGAFIQNTNKFNEVGNQASNLGQIRSFELTKPKVSKKRGFNEVFESNDKENCLI